MASMSSYVGARLYCSSASSAFFERSCVQLPNRRTFVGLTVPPHIPMWVLFIDCVTCIESVLFSHTQVTASENLTQTLSHTFFLLSSVSSPSSLRHAHSCGEHRSTFVLGVVTSRETAGAVFSFESGRAHLFELGAAVYKRNTHDGAPLIDCGFSCCSPQNRSGLLLLLFLSPIIHTMPSGTASSSPSPSPAPQSETPSLPRSTRLLPRLRSISNASTGSRSCDAALAASRAHDIQRRLRLARIDRVVLQERERENRQRLRTAEEDIFVDHLIPYYQLLQRQLQACRRNNASFSGRSLRSGRSGSPETRASRQVFTPLWGCYPTLASSLSSVVPSAAKEEATVKERWLHGFDLVQEEEAVRSSSFSPSLAASSFSFALGSPDVSMVHWRAESGGSDASAETNHISHGRASPLFLQSSSEGQGVGQLSRELPFVANTPLRSSHLRVPQADDGMLDASPEPRNPTLNFVLPTEEILRSTLDCTWSRPCSRVEEGEAPPASARTEAPRETVSDPVIDDSSSSSRQSIRDAFPLFTRDRVGGASTLHRSGSQGEMSNSSSSSSGSRDDGVKETSGTADHASTSTPSSRSLHSCFSDCDGECSESSCSASATSEAEAQRSIYQEEKCAVRHELRGDVPEEQSGEKDKPVVQLRRLSERRVECPSGTPQPVKTPNTLLSGSGGPFSAQTVADPSPFAATPEPCDKPVLSAQDTPQLIDICTPLPRQRPTVIFDAERAGAVRTCAAAPSAPPPRSHSPRAASTLSLMLPRLTPSQHHRDSTTSTGVHSGFSTVRAKAASVAASSSPLFDSVAHTPPQRDDTERNRELVSATSTEVGRDVAVQLFRRQDKTPGVVSPSRGAPVYLDSPTQQREHVTLSSADTPLLLLPPQVQQRSTLTSRRAPSSYSSYSRTPYPALNFVGSFSALQAEECVQRASLRATEYYEWSHRVRVWPPYALP